MSKLKNKFLKSKSIEDNKQAYSAQRNQWINLLRKTTKYYYSNLDVKAVIDDKKF